MVEFSLRVELLVAQLVEDTPGWELLNGGEGLAGVVVELDPLSFFDFGFLSEDFKNVR